jgi:hypothetical protein
MTLAPGAIFYHLCAERARAERPVFSLDIHLEAHYNITQAAGAPVFFDPGPGNPTPDNFSVHGNTRRS